MNYLVTYKYVEDHTKVSKAGFGDQYFLLSNLSHLPVDYLEKTIDKLKVEKKLASVILTGIFQFE